MDGLFPMIGTAEGMPGGAVGQSMETHGAIGQLSIDPTPPSGAEDRTTRCDYHRARTKL